MNREHLDHIINVVESNIASAGYECIEAEWVEDHRTLRVFVDHPKGVQLDDCAAVSRMLAEAKELDDAVPGTYNLEVSSPGVERPLRRLSHFQKVVGAMVEVKLLEQVLERKHAKGTLVGISSDDGIVTLDTNRGMWAFPLKRLQKASLVHDWGS